MRALKIIYLWKLYYLLKSARLEDRRSELCMSNMWLNIIYLFILYLFIYFNIYSIPVFENTHKK